MHLSEGMWCKGISWPEEKGKRNVPVSPPSVYHPDISCAIPMSAPSCHRSNTSQCASDGGDESAATREEEDTWKRHKSGGKEAAQPKRVMWQRLRVRFFISCRVSLTRRWGVLGKLKVLQRWRCVGGRGKMTLLYEFRRHQKFWYPLWQFIFSTEKRCIFAVLCFMHIKTFVNHFLRIDWRKNAWLFWLIKLYYHKKDFCCPHRKFVLDTSRCLER